MKSELVYSDYDFVRGQLKPGDVIAFSGKGWVSKTIKFFTRSKVSHVGIVLEISEQGRVMVMESTSLGGKKGVQVNRLSQRLDQYKGELWWLPLNKDVKESMDMAAFWHFLWEQDGKKYDTWQAIKSALPSFIRREHFDKFFCSELVAGALEAAEAIPELNASEMTPDDVVELPVYGKKYFQLKGERKAI